VKFRFAFESLLEHRKLEEEIARRDFNEAHNILDQQKALYKKLYTRLHEVESEVSQRQASKDGVSISNLLELDDFMAGQKVKIARQREVVINHTSIMEGKQEILIAAAKERKILEKLKEKKKAEHKKLMAKKDAKLNDEIVVTRFRDRRGEQA
jgi:flagellar FliJ protein